MSDAASSYHGDIVHCRIGTQLLFSPKHDRHIEKTTVLVAQGPVSCIASHEIFCITGRQLNGKILGEAALAGH
jgi:hypothetical protein